FGYLGIAVDDERFYVVGGPVAAACPLAGCGDAGVEQLGNWRGPIFGIASDGKTAYLAGYNRGVSDCPLSGCSSPEDEAVLASTCPATMGAAVDSTNVYWSEYSFFNVLAPSFDGAIRTCPRSGCDLASTKVLAAGPIGPYAMAVDETSLYYTDYRNGRVERI